MSRFELIKMEDKKLIHDTRQKLVFYPTSFITSWEEANKLAHSIKIKEMNSWRLPSLNELISLISHERFNPASDMPEIRAKKIMSRDVFIGNPNAVWAVNFYDGSVLTAGKQEECFVIFVRDDKIVNFKTPDPDIMEIEVFDLAEEDVLDIDIDLSSLKGYRPRDKHGRFLKINPEITLVVERNNNE